MNKCAKCGKEITEGAAFCPHCGEKVASNDNGKGTNPAAAGAAKSEFMQRAMKVLEDMKEKVENITIKGLEPGQRVPSDPADAVIKDYSGGAPSVISPDVRKASRPYSFCRAIRALKTGRWQNATVELEMDNLMRSLGYGDDAEGLLIPIDSKAIKFSEDEEKNFSMQRQIHEVMTKGATHKLGKIRQKSLSEGDASAGGYLVAPEQAAEIIELLRAQSVVLAAGAREIPLPKSGILPIPRQTGGGTAYWVGENAEITESEQTLGQLMLIAKKCASLCKLSNELISDATPSSEAFVREDLTRVMALKEDLAFMTGAGTVTEPLGIINHSNVTLLSLGTDGLVPTADSYSDLMTESESNNGKPSAFITHPRLKGVLRKTKDTAGNYIYSPATTTEPATIWGLPVFFTSQLPTNLVKGSAPNCTRIICGMMSEALIGRKAVLELDMSTQGDTPFKNYQTWVRAISRVDFGLRTENVFAHVADAKIA